MTAPLIVVALLDGTKEIIETGSLPGNQICHVKKMLHGIRGYAPASQSLFVDGIGKELQDHEQLHDIPVTSSSCSLPDVGLHIALSLLLTHGPTYDPINSKAKELEKCYRRSYSFHRSGKELKLIMLGDYGVGKTSLLQRMVDNIHQTQSMCSIQPEFARVAMNWHGDPRVEHPTRYSLLGSSILRSSEVSKTTEMLIWDTHGQELYFSLSRSYYRGANAAAIVFDVTNRESFLSAVLYWKKQLLFYRNVSQAAGRLLMESKGVVLIGTKSDKAEENCPFNKHYRPLPDIHTLVPDYQTIEKMEGQAEGHATGFANGLKVLEESGFVLGAEEGAPHARTQRHVRSLAAQNSGRFTTAQLVPLLSMANGDTDLVARWLHGRQYPQLFSEVDADVARTDLQVTPAKFNPYESVSGTGSQRQVSVEEAEAVAAAWGVPYVEVSAKTGQGASVALCAVTAAADLANVGRQHRHKTGVAQPEAEAEAARAETAQKRSGTKHDAPCTLM